MFLNNKSYPANSDVVGVVNKVFLTIFCAIPLAYSIPSNVWFNCPPVSPSLPTVAWDGYN